MRFLTAVCAVLSLSLFVGLSLAQDKPDTKKTESKPDAKKVEGKEGEAKPAAKKLDRGDEKAEKLLKKAWERVQSAEASGLERLKATAKIGVDASAFGMGEMPFDGTLLWKKGSRAIWNSSDDKAAEGNANPLGNVSAIAKGLFEPYLAYVTGFEAWATKFENANFKMGDPVKDDKDKQTGERVIVTFADEHTETFVVAENKVASMSREQDFNGNKTSVEFRYTYEDTGKKLRLSKVGATTNVDMSGMPGQDDPKNPVPKGSTKESLEGSIEIKKYGKAGEYDIAVELKGGIKFMGMEFPTKLTISDPKVNKDVTDDDLKPLDEETKTEDPKKKEDDEF
ncbi:MAG: hypothetical protein IPP14_06675 [Planctomycetes bacterium]|nr:hypothetical protein [Planctomycetota bacterium]